MDDNSNPVTFQPQAQPGEIDTRAAAQAMALYGLNPAEAADANEFARHFVEDSERGDPQLRDRYQRAARSAATSLRQSQAMRALGGLEDQRLANDRDAIWRISQYKAAPLTEQPKRVQSVLDTTDPGELWRMSQGKGDAVPDVINDQVTSQAWRKMQDAGVVIDESDPEAKLLDPSTPERFLASIDKAIEQKRAKSVYEITDPNELWKLARKQGLI